MRSKLSYFSLILFSTVTLNAIDITGTISYERVVPVHSGSLTGLNYSNISTETAKQITVEAVNSSNTVVGTTTTDDSGNYRFTSLPSNTSIKIRAYAKMVKTSGWDVRILNTGNNDSQYVIEGSLVSTGSSNSVRDLLATSSDKSSPPFAILDSVYLAMNKILNTDSSVVFPALSVSWSTENISTGSYYDGTQIVLQGDQSGDSDEYDTHVIIHEWGHYFEDKFSRADSTGGSHGAGEHLDIRLAFGEGFGNAFAAIVTDDPIYFDTSQANGWNMNIESDTKESPGWFSEASIQRILYDLYDSNDDDSDTLSLGFLPMYELFINEQKNTEAFTSLFSFVTELKNNNARDTAKIDSIVASEGITTIDDIYGTNRSSNVEEISLPIYSNLTVNETLSNICTSKKYGTLNKLNNHKFLKFTVTNAKNYFIQVSQTNGTGSYPQFTIYKASPFKEIGESTISQQTVTGNYTLTAGDYLIDIFDANKNSGTACFDISVGDTTDIDTTTTSAPVSSGSSGEAKSVGVELPSNPLLILLVLFGIMIIPMILMNKELSK
ncbi:MAG: Phage tail fiber protein [uncultured Sulfurovum sp.]|uniref:Phage tail fiber protein n=1 Tax=uncultured Sulfurovum sp. TaxID=269237 RepID=A0A6S6SPW1_9BACT|nr:MAG: Phage tail fiber protein [uncultured Sulfurovum sp.]